jgi:hypothetical protein
MGCATALMKRAERKGKTDALCPTCREPVVQVFRARI